MDRDASDEPTGLPLRARGGNRDPLDELMPLACRELRRLAGGYFRSERPDHTLQPTALANEVYIRLVDQSRVELNDRPHFFAIAGRMMRRVLVDHARSHRAQKRGSGGARLVFDESVHQAAKTEVDTMDERQARIVELRFFGGLTVEEIAQVMEISTATVKREWRTARAWLYRELSSGVAP